MIKLSLSKEEVMKYPIEVTETRSIKRVTFKQVFADFFNAFSVERGLVYTLRLLLVNPGKLIRNYLTDERFKLVGPFRLVILTTAVSVVVLYFADFEGVFQELEAGTNATNESLNVTAINIQKAFLDWYNLLLWIAIPIYALFSYLFFMGEGFNYAEHIVLQSFYVSALNVMYVVMTPISFVSDIESVFMAIFVIGWTYYVFVFLSFFSSKRFAVFLKSILAFVIGNLFYGLIMLFLLGIIVGYTMSEPAA